MAPSWLLTQTKGHILAGPQVGAELYGHDHLTTPEILGIRSYVRKVLKRHVQTKANSYRTFSWLYPSHVFTSSQHRCPNDEWHPEVGAERKLFMDLLLVNNIQFSQDPWSPHHYKVLTKEGYQKTEDTGQRGRAAGVFVVRGKGVGVQLLEWDTLTVQAWLA